MAAPLTLSLLPLLLLLLLQLLSTSTAAADCDPPSAVLLAAQVTELARTALTGEQRHLGRLGGGSGGVEAPTQLRSFLQLGGGGGGGGVEAEAQPGSCLQLQRANGSLPDGLYQLAGLDDPVYCDFSHDGGGWTLLLTAATRDGWDRLNVRLRNAGSPSLTDNYSILGRGDALKALGTGARFAYRLEAQAQADRRQWGGIWLAPREYTLTPETETQTDIALVKKFNKWTYGKPSLQKTMPWINVEDYLDGLPLLTTTLKASKDWWGTLITDPANTDYSHSPWIKFGTPHSGTILYWMREEILP